MEVQSGQSIFYKYYDLEHIDIFVEIYGRNSKLN